MPYHQTFKMERWENHVAVVTGASSGIGSCIFENLALAGFIVIGVARRVHLIQAIIDKQTPEVAARMHTHYCDLRIPKSVDDAYEYIISNFGGIDVLINDAGIAEPGMVITMDLASIHNVIQTNLFGYIYWAKKASQSLIERNASGHIIMISSRTGHYLPKGQDFSLNAYPIAKFGVTALREVLAEEFRITGNRNVKVSNISPGAVDTPMWDDMNKPEAILQPQDIADAVLYILRTPSNVQVNDLMISAVGEMF